VRTLIAAQESIMAATRRTTMYSTAGKKLYAVRNPDGSFKDIQTYERAHGADMARKSQAETATARKVARKKAAVKKSPAKKAPARKAAAKKAPARKVPAKKKATAKKAARRK
jgi:DNA-binding protein HU-beta